MPASMFQKVASGVVPAASKAGPTGPLSPLLTKLVTTGPLLAPVTVPLVNSFNALTSNHTARIAAGRDRLPPPILALLAVSAVGAAYLVGAARGRTGNRLGVSAVFFVTLVSAIVWVTLDLNQPARGLITVDQEPMEQVLTWMG